MPILGRIGGNLREKRGIPEPIPRSIASLRPGCQGEWSTLLEREWHGEGCLTEAVAECGGRPLRIWQAEGWRPSLPLHPLGLLRYHLWVNAEETRDASRAGVPPGTERGEGGCEGTEQGEGGREGTEQGCSTAAASDLSGQRGSHCRARLQALNQEERARIVLREGRAEREEGRGYSRGRVAHQQ